ncbi:uncharacterized protein BCR38DRAFT_414559 [Pseudomassariella vexata]|uniref:Uncharacterized protein n=1 Tax=Pseudomassariella vexata TaxID=1141098 RepID=A0A1Y2DAW6_9PEZI|nr:uncharacterized protein BCR38DRAFT_414559 [Pseudomassariella vexata]ORY56408.1 hypothetical protein BCR38DRAFT_414559 [Pseudomassariella vexata]
MVLNRISDAVRAGKSEFHRPKSNVRKGNVYRLPTNRAWVLGTWYLQACLARAYLPRTDHKQTGMRSHGCKAALGWATWVRNGQAGSRVVFAQSNLVCNWMHAKNQSTDLYDVQPAWLKWYIAAEAQFSNTYSRRGMEWLKIWKTEPIGDKV